MTEFVSWVTLGTYSGALAMVFFITQFTKSLPVIRKMPTQLWSYILAVCVLLPATIFTLGFHLEEIILIFFNAFIISVAANGVHSVGERIIHNKNYTDGDLLIDTSAPTKDIYRLDINSLDNITSRKTITLNVKPNQDLSPKG